ncbi:ABC transporter substrate-binding protein [Acrocarpospora phusangensis]|uniref:ABC transporter substrate-binding protein n=1 Tax=Acrocarpospora phusangensis TaxID=1070424 RepID=UPI001EF1CA48|nr:ABC transporter substrate-binding protein [Acrocarpospora phusangensis]
MKIRDGVALAAIVMVAAACGGHEDHALPGGGGIPQPGGTLKVVGSGDVDHLDPSSSYTVVAYNLNRTWTRQLVTYPASNDFEKAIAVVPDVAESLPEISGDGRTYTFKIRQGVRWNTKPARQVTAADFVRGLKRLANPVQPSGGISYYTQTIEGMQEFFNAFQKAPKTAAGIAHFMAANQIKGVRAVDAATLEIRLTNKASDFLNIMALPFASPAPVEYEKFVPDGPDFRQNTISLGPYQIGNYQAGRTILLVRNPSWNQEADPVRHQYVDRIQITLGQESADVVQQLLEAGLSDLSWDQPVPTSAIQRLNGDPGFHVYEGSSLNPFLVFNLQSPNNNRALADVKVRQAINYAVNKVAIAQIFGGPRLNTVVEGAIPPGSIGFDADVKPYMVPGHTGDPAKCRTMLAQAGVSGLVLQFPYRTTGNHAKVAQSIAGDLGKCGITSNLIATSPDDFYGRYLSSVAKSREGKWDIGGPGWLPDWYGNNGRSVVVPLFDGRNYTEGSTNYGAYNNPAVNALIDKALTAGTESAAAGYWKEANAMIMADAPIVPVISQNVPTFHSSRVQNAVYSPLSQQFDYTQLWLG